MPVNTHILEMLENKNAIFNIEKIADDSSLSHLSKTSGNCIVNAILLSDGSTTYQLLLPADFLIDVQEVSEFLGKKIVSIDTEIRLSLLKEQELTHIPAIPHWQGFRTLVDEKLLTFTNLLLRSGSYDGLLSMNQNDFSKLIDKDDVCEFSEPLDKPMHDASMDEAAIKETLTHFTELRIKQRLEETLELPPLPQTAQRIIELRADFNADINDLAEVVEKDPSLAAQVVSWASSPYYSAPGKIKSVHDAIMRVLGFDMVLNLSLGIALGKTLECKDITPKQLNDYWCKAVYKAAAMEALVTRIEKSHRPNFGFAYLSGLLHNFGFLILADVFPPYFSNIVRYQNANPHIDNMSVEQYLLGSSSNQIAAWLLDNWSMPEDVVLAIRQQFNPAYSGQACEYAQLLYVAQQLLAEHGFGDELPKPIPDSLYSSLHLDRKSAEDAIESIIDSSSDLNEIAKKLTG